MNVGSILKESHALSPEVREVNRFCVCATQILREQVQACYMKEGVNSMQNCKEVVMDYLESIKGIGLGRMNSGRYDKSPPQAPLE